MKNFLAFLLFMLLSKSIVRAGLGETPNQLEARYGKPMVEKTWEGALGDFCRSYVCEKMWLDVQFVDGVSEQEQYRPAEKGKFSDRSFSDAEVQSLLAINERNGKWANMPKLDDLDADGCVAQQGVNLYNGKNLVADASVSKIFVSITSTKFFLLRTHMAPHGNISGANLKPRSFLMCLAR